MSDVTLSRSDLFLVLFAAIALAHMVGTIVKVTVLSYLQRAVSRRIVDRAAEGAELIDKLSRTRVDLHAPGALDEVRTIQEGAFLAGWRSCEECRGHATRPESEDHILHHFTWRDAAKVTTACARADRDKLAIAALENMPSIAPFYGPAVPPGIPCAAIDEPTGLRCDLIRGHSGPHAASSDVNASLIAHEWGRDA